MYEVVTNPLHVITSDPYMIERFLSVGGIVFGSITLISYFVKSRIK